MKQLLLVSTILLTFFYTAIGQKEASIAKKTQITFGPVINYNFGSITLGEGQNRAIRGLNLSDFKAFGGGIIVDFKYKNGIFLQTGLLYDTRTVEDKEFISLDSNPFASSFSLQVAYINMPLIVGYTFGKGKTQPYFSTGLQIGKGTKEKVSNIYKEELPSYITKNEPIFEFDGAEFSFLVEVGLRKSLGKTTLVNLGLQYMGGDRGTFINRTSIAGGAVNLGTKRMAINFSFLFNL